MDECPHNDYCKIMDDCPPNEYYWKNCWVYRTFEGILDNQIYMAKRRKMKFNRERGFEGGDKL